jgi:hypothetical protein
MGLYEKFSQFFPSRQNLEKSQNIACPTQQQAAAAQSPEATSIN